MISNRFGTSVRVGWNRQASTLTRAFYGVKRTWTRTGPQSLVLFGRANPSDKLLLTFPCTLIPL